MVELFIDTHSSDETFLDGKPITVEGSDGEKVCPCAVVTV